MKTLVIFFTLATLLCMLYQEAHGFIDKGRHFPTGQFQLPNAQPADRGTWGVTVNKNGGQGPQVRSEAAGNLYKSRDGNWRVDLQANNEFGKGRKPSTNGLLQVTGRFKRSEEFVPFSGIEELSETDHEEFSRMKRSQPRVPAINQEKGAGTWGVTMNKDKGKGPQVRTEGQRNIYTSPNGNWKVDGRGHHEFGKGRKPSYGGEIKVQGRWRRSASDEADADELDTNTRMKRSFSPGGAKNPPQAPQGDRGTWGVSVNKNKGRGPQVRTEAQGNVYTSPNGNWKVDAHGNHEFGKGRKPSYGGGVQVQGRWRRSLDEVYPEVEDSEDLSTLEQVITESRFRRAANPQQKDRGSIGVTINQEKGQGPQVRTEGQQNIYTSRNGNWRVDGHGHHEFGRGRKPDYGAGIRVQGRWRRSAEDEIDQEDENTEESSLDIEPSQVNNRQRRSPDPQEKKGSVSVSVNHEKGKGPQVRTDVSRNIYTSRDKSWQVSGQGYHEAGRGRKPSYGGQISLSKRF